MTTQTKLRTRDLTDIALFAVAITVCSWISIPMVIPVTMQTFGVFLAVGVLGGKRGTMAVLTYLTMGLMGLPVFSGFSGGIGALAGATGGYIVGFLLSALVMWALESLLGRSTAALALSMVLGLVVCYFFGTVWFMAVYAKQTGTIGVWSALSMCVFPYVLPDGAKIALALAVRKRLCRAMKREAEE